MRDPRRIDEILELIEVFWKKYPDMRLGQIISSAIWFGGWDDKDPFYCEDDLLRDGLSELINNANPSRKERSTSRTD